MLGRGSIIEMHPLLSLYLIYLAYLWVRSLISIVTVFEYETACGI